MANLVGQKLGHYQILEVVGQGGMATVYRAYDSKADRDVAIKVLSPYVAQEPKFKARFIQEVKVLIELRHPNIVSVLDYGEEGAYAYIVMPYMTAGTLAQRLNKGPLPLSVANEVLQQLAGAMDYAHSRKVIHRDIKPSNILIDAGGRAMITDFGFARVADKSLSITGSGLIGTPAYMSPEQCRGEEATPLSDQYAFGVVLYQMVTGSLPFEAETPLGVVIMHATEPLPPPREVYPELPQRVEAVIIRALEKKPEERYPSMLALKEAFHLAVSGKAGSIGQTVYDQPTAVFDGFAARWAKFRIKLRGARRPSIIIILALLVAGFFGYYRLAADGGGSQNQTLTATPSSTELSADLLATIDALNTANAPVEGTLLAPGEIETLVAGTMSVLISAAETTTADVTATPENTATPTIQVLPATSTPIRSPTPLPSTTTATAEFSTETSTPTISKTPRCKGPDHPQFPCTPTPGAPTITPTATELSS
ncbi:MAG: protein kinase [Chloroflexi bacterium]|nr:protein kinase [Chloroflexota bacterium]